MTGAEIVIMINSLKAVVANVGQNGKSAVIININAIMNMLAVKKRTFKAKRAFIFGTILCKLAVKRSANSVCPPPKTTSKIPNPKNKL